MELFINIITKKQIYGLLLIIGLTILGYKAINILIEKIIVRGENDFDKKRKLTVEAEGDTVEQNNFMVAAAIVEAPKKTLLISGLNEDRVIEPTAPGLTKLFAPVSKSNSVSTAFSKSISTIVEIALAGIVVVNTETASFSSALAATIAAAFS